MYPRVLASFLAFFLAFALLGSCLGTIEAPLATASPAVLSDGSAEDHHLDDLPTQAQADPSFETPALLPGGPAVDTGAPVMAPPRPFAAAATKPPFLAGPLRPPRGTSRVA